MFLGGMRDETLKKEIVKGLTVSEFGKRAGITFSGCLIEYRLDDVEDLKTITLLLKPSTERKYICRCMQDSNKLPMHIFPGDILYALERLSQVCNCNLNFIDYFKNK